LSDDERTRRLSGDEIAALTFAARRQLTRWANRGDLQPREQAQRATLIRAVRVLNDRALARGCILCAHSMRSSDARSE
jgi:hypothetical protein